MDYDETKRAARRPRRRTAVFAAALLLATATVGSAAVDAKGPVNERAHVMDQGGDGLYQHNGARLTRTDHSVEIDWKVRTPEPGSYTYPTPDMVPPGAPIHPPIEPGHPEVFTLWVFAFDHPENCSDGVCDGNDIGDTPARGSVYQLDGERADRHRLRMGGKIRLGQAPANGPGLGNPLGADVHVAMAPHGTALEGADFVRQLNSPVGGPPLWFVAFFIAG